ncbi:Phosphate transport system permease protein PstA [Enhygromyxa salina]|uniref:Phosphate transport system permease protein PstA n=1 Tax=Enhygromyxa salina TaxID=215803 RepID=A0A2S9YEC5_9BACT|nr:ABC transporter permease subunit [Enhygromyxa salina]PRQ03443.1 Phosphate transport system permease protein PstA [Enhygromyxa salina]
MSGRKLSASDRALRWLCAAAVLVPIAVLSSLLVSVALVGFTQLDAEVLAAVGGALRDSVYLGLLSAGLAVPLGVGAAIGLEQYGARATWAELLDAKVAVLAGVPSVIYGLLGLELFARALSSGRGLLAGALTIALLVSPMIFVASREALRGVSASQREAGLALGGTRWQIVRHVVLPMAIPGIVSGTILAVARALGSAAPLLVLGGFAAARVAPEAADPLAVLPVRIFSWIAGPAREGAGGNAAAGSFVLMVVCLGLHGLALVIRGRSTGPREAEA